MPLRPMIRPPVGKSGPWMIWHSSSMVTSGLSRCARHASMTSPRLCGGMFVAMPTAMPPAPLTEQVGELRRQHRRLQQAVVVVRLEVDRVLVEVVEQVLRDLREPRLGVAFGRGRVAVDGAEVALAVDERHAQRELLRHAHERVVDGEVAVRMEVAHRVAHDFGRLHVLLVPVEPKALHRVEDAPVHRLQAVAHVGQRARDDDAHRVLEVRALHLLGDGNGADVARLFAAGRLVVGVVGHDFVLSADSATHAFWGVRRGAESTARIP